MHSVALLRIPWARWVIKHITYNSGWHDVTAEAEILKCSASVKGRERLQGVRRVAHLIISAEHPINSSSHFATPSPKCNLKGAINAKQSAVSQNLDLWSVQARVLTHVGSAGCTIPYHWVWRSAKWLIHSKKKKKGHAVSRWRETKSYQRMTEKSDGGSSNINWLSPSSNMNIAALPPCWAADKNPLLENEKMSDLHILYFCAFEMVGNHFYFINSSNAKADIFIIFWWRLNKMIYIISGSRFKLKWDFINNKEWKSN